MRILVDLELPCSPDTAWRALHDPTVAARLYSPALQMVPLGKLPETWSSGDSATISLRAFGRFTVGTHSITITDHTGNFRGQQFRVMQDSGTPLSGPLTLLSMWNHQMAVAPVPTDPTRTQWRERLLIGGPMAPVFYPVLWVMWKVRSIRVRKLAQDW